MIFGRHIIIIIILTKLYLYLFNTSFIFHVFFVVVTYVFINIIFSKDNSHHLNEYVAHLWPFKWPKIPFNHNNLQCVVEETFLNILLSAKFLISPLISQFFVYFVFTPSYLPSREFYPAFEKFELKTPDFFWSKYRICNPCFLSQIK